MINDFFSNLADKLSGFFKDNFITLIAAAAAGIFVYGFEIANVTLSIDEELFLQIPNATHTYIEHGRWGLFILAKVLPSLGYFFLSPVISVIFLSLAAVTLISVYPVSKGAKVLFALLFVTFPAFFHMQEFVYQAPYVAISVFFCSAAIRLYQTAFTKNKLFFIPAVLLVTFAVGSYQSLISVFMAGAVFTLVLDFVLNKKSFKKAVYEAFIACLIAAAAAALHLLITDLSIASYTNHYKDKFFKWNKYPIYDIFKNWATQIYRLSIGLREYPQTMTVSIAASLGIIARQTLKSGNKIKEFIKITVAITVFYISAISITVLLGGFPPLRSLIGLNIFFAGSICIYYIISSKTEKFLIIVAACFVILANASLSARLSASDYWGTQADITVALRIMDLIYDEVPGIQTGAENPPIAFIGHYSNYAPTGLVKQKDNDVFGGSFWDWDAGNPYRMLYFMNTIGFPVTARLANISQYPEALEYAENMPPYPDKNSVKLYGDVIIVKLN